MMSGCVGVTSWNEVAETARGDNSDRACKYSYTLTVILKLRHWFPGKTEALKKGDKEPRGDQFYLFL